MFCDRFWGSGAVRGSAVGPGDSATRPGGSGAVRGLQWVLEVQGPSEGLLWGFRSHRTVCDMAWCCPFEGGAPVEHGTTEPDPRDRRSTDQDPLELEG